MKRNISAALLFLIGVLAFAEVPVPFFGNNNFTIDVDTIFSADANDGSTGLETDLGVGLWFEFTPYADRNITPQRDTLSVSLKLVNSAFYAWRGFDLTTGMHDGDQVPSDVSIDQAKSVWFDTFAAQLEYNQWWMRIAGIDPEISISQASIRSVFDPIMENRTDIAKNRIPLPLFYVPGNALGGSWSHNRPGITSVINRDIVHLNRREVEIAGNLSAGMKGEIFDFIVKGGSWKKAEENNLNAWVLGADASCRPDLTQAINFSFLTATNYETVTRKGGFENEEVVNDPLADPEAMKENPIALSLGYDYRINLPMNMIIKPYAGIDFIYDFKSKSDISESYNIEFGGGLQWYFRGTGAKFKRNAKIGGIQIGDVEIPAALIAGMNVDKNGFCNAIISFNEDPHLSPLRNTGGWLQLEMLNLSGKKYHAVNGQTYNDSLIAGMAQIEYLAHPKIMPYVFARFVPYKLNAAATSYKTWTGDLNTAPVFSKDITSLTSKLGCRFMPFNYFSIDVWYERTDVRSKKDWALDKGLFAINFGVRNYL